jgi:hypothetical protein
MSDAIPQISADQTPKWDTDVRWHGGMREERRKRRRIRGRERRRRAFAERGVVLYHSLSFSSSSSS